MGTPAKSAKLVFAYEVNFELTENSLLLLRCCTLRLMNDEQQTIVEIVSLIN